MPVIPQPHRLSLHDAINYAAERCKCETEKAGKAVHAALGQGALVASAKVLVSDRSYMPGIIAGPLPVGPPHRVDAGIGQVPPELWAETPWPDFLRRAVLPFGNPMFKGQPGTPVYSNPTIATADIDAWLEFNERSHQTMAQGSVSFTAEVCGNGHATTSAVESSPELTAKFCSICGSATIRACPECNAPIQGQNGRYWEDLPSRYVPDEYSPPNHCDNCGAPFPWTRARLQAAKEHAAEIEGLDEHERQQLPGIIDDLASGGPRTELAAGSFKRIIKKVGPTVGSVFQRVVVDVASETAKKLLGGV
jgi:hypothetical protein